MKISKLFASVNAMMFTGISAAMASLVGSGGIETYLNDNTEVIHTFNESGTFSLYSDVEARVLVVGGGGGGGFDCGGGGGGGGVIDETITLKAGTYLITVGKGGSQGIASGQKGYNGEDSIIFDASGNKVVFQAFGGGGGGAYSSGAGSNGGCGGGPANWGKAGKGVDGQGYPSVDATTSPQGGGGAGGSPVQVHNDKGSSTVRMSAGGPGRASDITGVVDYYGPGGGAGGYNGLAGLGGDTIPDADGFIWGCGYSAGSDDNSMKNNFQYAQGRPNHGGGGGGSKNWGAGASGGSGVVIIRMENKSTVINPTVAAGVIQTRIFSALIPVSVEFAGANSQSGKVVLSLQISNVASDFAEDGSFAREEIVLDDAFFGGEVFEINDLRPAETYFVRLVVENDAGDKSFSSVITFTLPKQEEVVRIDTFGRSVTDGLLQKRYPSSSSFIAYDETDETLVAMPGAIAAGLSSGNNASGLYTSLYVDKDGNEWRMDSGYGYSYLGYMWLEAGSSYNFFSNFQDVTKLKIDGELVLECGYNTPTVGTYECTETGWHRIQLWLQNGRGSAGTHGGWAYSFGWNKDGATVVSEAPGTIAWKFLSVEYGAKLKTGIPGRDIIVNSYSPNGSNIDFGLNISSGDEGQLYVLYGDTYEAEDQDAWDNVALVGDISATEASFVTSVPKALYTRFMFVHPDGSTSWSYTAQIDLTSVAIRDEGVAHDGDTGTFNVNVGSVGVGEFSLKLLLSTSQDMSGAKEYDIPVSNVGNYSYETSLEPGTTYYYQYVATTSEGGNDLTEVVSFTTKAGTVLPVTPTTTVNSHTVTISMKDFEIGAGETTYKVFVGKDSNSMVEHDFFFAADAAQSYIKVVIDGLPQDWELYVASENSIASGSSWTSQTGIFSVTTRDLASYTWNKEVAEGYWDDPNSWKPSNIPADGVIAGYPLDTNNGIYFEAGTVATVYISDIYYYLEDLNLGSKDGLRVRFVGKDAATSKIRFDMFAGTMNDEYVEFSAMTLGEKDTIDRGIGSYVSTNSVFKFTNGAVFSQGGSGVNIRGTNVTFAVESGSSVTYKDMALGSTGGDALVVDDATFTVTKLSVETAEHLENVNVRIAGAAPTIAVKEAILLDTESVAGNNDLTVIFDVPNGGYTNAAPLYATSSKVLPLGTYKNADSTAKLIVKIDPKSIQLRGGERVADGHLILWESGIDTNNVVVEDTRGAVLSYTYGWPSDLDEPEEVGQRPTGLKCFIPATAATVIFIK